MRSRVLSGVKRRYVLLAAAALAIGVGCVLYHGPGRPFIRGHVGDVGATMLVYALLGFTGWRRRTRTVLTLAIAVSMELGQLVWHSIGSSGAGAIVLGSVADPWDLVAYVIGTAIGVACDPPGPAGTGKPG